MRRIQRRIMTAFVAGTISIGAVADPIMQSGPDRAATATKQSALIGRIFSMRGGNAFGSGLVSVGYLPHSRTTVAAYFISVTADYGKGVIVPDMVMEEEANATSQKTGEGLEVTYVNCKTQTYSSLSFPMFKELSNAERSMFVAGSAAKWTQLAETSFKDAQWIIELSDDGAKDMARFFADLCEATY